MKGKITFFHQVKGYGFIESDGESVFFHISELEDYKQVRIDVGQEVEFEVEKMTKDNKLIDKAVKIKKVKEV